MPSLLPYDNFDDINGAVLGPRVAAGVCRAPCRMFYSEAIPPRELKIHFMVLPMLARGKCN